QPDAGAPAPHRGGRGGGVRGRAVEGWRQATEGRRGVWNGGGGGRNAGERGWLRTGNGCSVGSGQGLPARKNRPPAVAPAATLDLITAPFAGMTLFVGGVRPTCEVPPNALSAPLHARDRDGRAASCPRSPGGTNRGAATRER